MGKLKQLTAEQAEDRLNWLCDGTVSLEMDLVIHDVPDAIWAAGLVDAKVIEKLHEISQVARELAKHYTDKGAQVTWEIGDEGAG